MLVGTEWLVDASGCLPEALRDLGSLGEVFRRIVADLELKAVGAEQWHPFPGDGGVTGLLLLRESHLACHTYPELGVATFNLYCCRERPEWNWREQLAELLGARRVTVRRIERQSDGEAPLGPAARVSERGAS